MTTRLLSLGSAAISAPSFLYSGVRCLQWPHLYASRPICRCLYGTPVWTVPRAKSNMQSMDYLVGCKGRSSDSVRLH